MEGYGEILVSEIFLLITVVKFQVIPDPDTVHVTLAMVMAVVSQSLEQWSPNCGMCPPKGVQRNIGAGVAGTGPEGIPPSPLCLQLRCKPQQWPPVPAAALPTVSGPHCTDTS